MTDRPNVVFILCDQLRPDYLSCYGARHVSTPNIDRLARSGIRYENAFSLSPLCVPARASLLTGHNSIVNGVTGNNQWLRPDHEACGLRSWPGLLAERGYKTEAIGKMHFYPWDIQEGFGHRIIAEDKRHIGIRDDYSDYLAEHGLEKYHGSQHDGYHEGKGAYLSRVPAEHQVDVWVADRTVDFLHQHDSDDPFALMVGFPGPHCPYDPPPERSAELDFSAMPTSIPATSESQSLLPHMIESFRLPWSGLDYSSYSESQVQVQRAHYSLLVKQIDEQVGRITEALEEVGLADNTVLIFASDHGDFLGDFGLAGKKFFYDPSIRVPLIVSSPDGPRSEVCHEYVSLTDVRATILTIGGYEQPETADSRALPTDARGRQHEDRMLFGALGSGVVALDSSYKYCRYQTGLTELYDRRSDTAEQRNLASDPAHAAAAQRYADAAFGWVLESVERANSINRVLARGEVKGASFGERGWQRRYPAPGDT